MTIRELIAALSQFDPDEVVEIYDNGPGDGGNEIIGVRLTDQCLKPTPTSRYKYDNHRRVLIDMDGHA